MEQMITDRPALVQTHKTWGLYTGIAVILVSAVLYVTKMQAASWGRWVPIVVLLAGILANANAFSKANGGAVTFGQVFTSCFKATAIITLLGVAWVLISVYVFPNMKAEALEMAQREMEGSPDMTEAQLKMGMDGMRKYFTLITAGSALFGYMFFGLLASLVGGAVAPKNKMPR